jgi:predicted dehydrogenase
VSNVPVVGLVGCGAWGHNILRDLVALGATVVVVDRSERGAEHARSLGAAAHVKGLEDLGEVDGVVVAVQVVNHASVVDALLPRHIPIFVEKPFTDDPATAERLAEQAPDRVFVMDKWRYHPGVEHLATIARSGELGPVIGLETVRVAWGNPHSDVDSVWVLAPHDLAIGLEILGTIPPPRVAIADRNAAGAVGLSAVLGDDPWFTLRVGTRSARRCREVTLRCRDGLATLADGWDTHVTLLRDDEGQPGEPTLEQRDVSAELPLLRELRAFLHHLEGGPAPRSSAAEGAEIVRTISDLRSLAGLRP